MTNGAWKNHNSFEAFTRNGSADFQVMEDGQVWIGVETSNIEEFFIMSKEQFDSFKE
jgi:hypothetical protein